MSGFLSSLTELLYAVLGMILCHKHLNGLVPVAGTTRIKYIFGAFLGVWCSVWVSVWHVNIKRRRVHVILLMHTFTITNLNTSYIMQFCKTTTYPPQALTYTPAGKRVHARTHIHSHIRTQTNPYTRTDTHTPLRSQAVLCQYGLCHASTSSFTPMQPISHQYRLSRRKTGRLMPRQDVSCQGRMSHANIGCHTLTQTVSHQQTPCHINVGRITLVCTQYVTKLRCTT